ncbi:formate dehydrogenase accessory sulfurtransferase FdhD [soil metagenome]
MIERERYAERTPRRRGTSTRRSIRRVRVQEVDRFVARDRRDFLATEEPLEIRVATQDGDAVPISVTMRTPGSDFELAAGFLYGEGLIESGASIRHLRYCVDVRFEEQLYNAVQVDLVPGVMFDAGRLQRNFYMTSSCGVCGKSSIEAIMDCGLPPIMDTLRVTPEQLIQLPAKLRTGQQIFERTGGLHATARFDAAGSLLDLREDVGRHNAMDKLVGAALLNDLLPFTNSILLVSGRLSFELVQKAARAGVELLAGVSAPSSLAVELAEKAGMTLVGFLREDGFNIYTSPGRIQMSGDSPHSPGESV